MLGKPSKKKVWKFPYLTDSPPPLGMEMFPRSCLIVLANKNFLPPEKVKILRKFAENPHSEAQNWNYSKSQAP